MPPSGARVTWTFRADTCIVMHIAGPCRKRPSCTIVTLRTRPSLGTRTTRPFGAGCLGGLRKIHRIPPAMAELASTGASQRSLRVVSQPRMPTSQVSARSTKAPPACSVAATRSAGISSGLGVRRLSDMVGSGGKMLHRQSNVDLLYLCTKQQSAFYDYDTASAECQHRRMRLVS